ncbi:MAG: DUF1624 domain-containing protein [Candidatus Diapherotrites archaeon]|nr:DUF1624 domain-containing protein [Candidatus Diapherotrites archaeon]
MEIRFWELDFLRGIAVVMMIVFHFLWDLNYFGIIQQPLYVGFWGLFQKITAISFLLLVGICLTISHNNAVAEKIGYKMKFLKRGARIFGLGLLITLMTFIFVPQGTIIFGVLHLIGASIILSILFVKLKYANALLGIAFIAIGAYLQALVFNFPWLVWLGFLFRGFYTFDYYPLLPWFGVILIGIFLGNMLYKNAGRAISIKQMQKPIFANKFEWLGRHSLVIYFIHQPVLIALLLIAQQFL